MRLKSFDEFLYRELQDREFAAPYLEDAITDSLDELLVALRKVVQANGGMARSAEDSQLSREAMYTMLSENGNPVVRSLEAILRAHGMQLSVKPREPTF